MSCCGGSCGCGSGCKCGSGCGGCGMYPDMEKSTTFTIIEGVAPITNYGNVEEKAAGEGCKCGSNCTCDPCNC
ncbi:hypothetical protein KY290_021927 [Solanum tuberosum]|uniref:Metallothionein-like protein n=1 Tax=Solanum tuberosum TaxID=4113 RepID=A0ABQ7V2Z9_SOLTU|nr:hypothetical protein KY284_020918 [Solanum tuberosum]KAH0683335.1 hypothetical protein KY289_021087 [Solanum tuberosum]KAH0758434.1 hypothetical protein KY290_021927 [Solanum tuberosum]